MHTPLISVIIPVFNSEQFIVAALRSVLSQTIQDFEILIIDDGSTDNTISSIGIIQDKRVHIFTKNKTDGPSATRNFGVLKAQGKYIAFLDADDLWLPTHLALHLSAHQEKSSMGLSFSRVHYINSLGEKSFFRKHYWKNSLLPHDIFCYNPIVTCSCVFVLRKLLLKYPFNENIFTSGDIELWVRLAVFEQGCIWNIDDITVLYRINPGSVSFLRVEQALVEFDKTIKAIYEYAPQLVDMYWRRSRANYLRQRVQIALRVNKIVLAMRFFYESIFIDWRGPFKRPFVFLVIMGWFFVAIIALLFSKTWRYITQKRCCMEKES